MIALGVRPRPAVAWLVGIGVSALIHVCVVLVLSHMPAPTPVFEPAMMLELAPLTQPPVAPQTPEPAEEPAPNMPAAAREAAAAAEPEVAPPIAPVQEQPMRQEAPVPPILEPAPVLNPTPQLPTPQPPVTELAAPDSPPVTEMRLPEAPNPQAPVPEPPVPVPPPRPVARAAQKPAVAPRPVTRPAQPTPETTAAPPAVAPASSLAQPSAQATADWRARLLAHLNRFKRYPATALMRRVQGVAFVHLILMPDGSAQDIRLHASSGAAVLDEEALALIGRATPLPPRPDSGPTELVVPVQFAVR